MTKRSGGINQSSSSSPSVASRGFSKDTMPPNINRRLESKMFQSEKFRTIILTSSIWLAIVVISVAITLQYSSTKSCSQNSLIKSKHENFI